MCPSPGHRGPDPSWHCPGHWLGWVCKQQVPGTDLHPTAGTLPPPNSQQGPRAPASPSPQAPVPLTLLLICPEVDTFRMSLWELSSCSPSLSDDSSPPASGEMGASLSESRDDTDSRVFLRNRSPGTSFSAIFPPSLVQGSTASCDSPRRTRTHRSGGRALKRGAQSLTLYGLASQEVQSWKSGETALPRPAMPLGVTSLQAKFSFLAFFRCPNSSSPCLASQHSPSFFRGRLRPPRALALGRTSLAAACASPPSGAHPQGARLPSVARAGGGGGEHEE